MGGEETNWDLLITDSIPEPLSLTLASTTAHLKLER